MSTTRTICVILAALLAIRMLFLVVLPVTDPSEGRYAEIAREMAATGDYITPRIPIDGEIVPFLGKPPLHFWISAAAIRAFGPSGASARIPSLAAACLLIALLYRTVKGFRGRRPALIAVLLTASSGLFFVLSGVVLTDMTLGLCIVGALLCYMAFLGEPDRSGAARWSLGVFGFLGLGFLCKGPVAIVQFGLPVLVWTAGTRQWAHLRRHAWAGGIALFLAISVPWFILCELRNPGFLRYFLVNENFLRFIRPDYGDRYGTGHVFPRGTALLMFAGAAAPWSFWLPYLLRNRDGWRALRREFSDPLTGIAIAGFISIPLFWAGCRQLLITYLLPAVPLYAIWLACRLEQTKAPSVRFVVKVAGGLAGLYAIGLGCAVPITHRGRSAQDPVAVVRRLAGGTLPGTPSVYFARRVPYSAYYYGGDAIVPHPVENPAESLGQEKAGRGGYYYIVRERYMDDVPADVLSRYREVGRMPGWIVFVRGGADTGVASARAGSGAQHDIRLASRRGAKAELVR